MPRVHFVKAARKDNSAVKKGEPYYWWKFRHGGKRLSKNRPRPSQLTRSKMSGVYAAQEQVEDLTIPDPSDFDGPEALAERLTEMKSVWDDSIQMIRDIAEEYRESAQNMEEYFPNGSSQIDEINEKADQLESDADEAETLADEFDNAINELEGWEANDEDADWKDDAASYIDSLPTAIEINV